VTADPALASRGAHGVALERLRIRAERATVQSPEPQLAQRPVDGSLRSRHEPRPGGLRKTAPRTAAPVPCTCAAPQSVLIQRLERGLAGAGFNVATLAQSGPWSNVSAQFLQQLRAGPASSSTATPGLALLSFCLTGFGASAPRSSFTFTHELPNLSPPPPRSTPGAWLTAEQLGRVPVSRRTGLAAQAVGGFPASPIASGAAARGSPQLQLRQQGELLRQVANHLAQGFGRFSSA